MATLASLLANADKFGFTQIKESRTISSFIRFYPKLSVFSSRFWP
jgi:hypothetical protein